MDIYEAGDSFILREIGARIKLCRLNLNITQEKLSEMTGVSRNCIQALEQGKRGISLLSFIKILRGLEQLDQIDVLLPKPEISPIALAEMDGKKRKRASMKKDS